MRQLTLYDVLIYNSARLQIIPLLRVSFRVVVFGHFM
jgi:hypothetical protein